MQLALIKLRAATVSLQLPEGGGFGVGGQDGTLVRLCRLHHPKHPEKGAKNRQTTDSLFVASTTGGRA